MPVLAACVACVAGVAAAPALLAAPGAVAVPHPAATPARPEQPAAGQGHPTPVVWPPSPRTDPDPDLHVVTRSTPAGEVPAGGTITYGFTVRNGTAAGTDTATRVVLTDRLPTGASYVAGSNPGCSATGPVVRCAVTDLARGDSGALLFDVLVGDVPAGTVLGSSGTVSAVAATSGDHLVVGSNTVTDTVTRSGPTGAAGGAATGALPDTGANARGAPEAGAGASGIGVLLAMLAGARRGGPRHR